MSVYFIKAQDLIKIGYSANVERRVRAVLSPFQDGGEILAVMPGDRALEAFLHAKFSSHHSHGEWFFPCEDIDTFIKMVGAPAEVPLPDRADERSLVQVYDDKYAEDCADCIHAARRQDRETDSDAFYDAIADWTGIHPRRLREIHLGKAGVVSSAEYTLCRALGEAAGFVPSLIVDGGRRAVARLADRSRTQG